MRKAAQQRTTSKSLPAPIGGVVASSIYSNSQENDSMLSAIWMYNFIAGEYGCRVRPGSREFATGLVDKNAVPADVKTILYYAAVTADGVGDLIFGVTNDGIFDITSGGAGPHTKVLDWPNKSDDAGWVSYVNYTNVAGSHFLLVCDEFNGYYIYDGTTWAQGTFTAGPNSPEADELVQVSEWQGRIWFVQRDAARAWFLDPLALTGDITPIDVGGRFKRGGYLVQCTTWTLDDGQGMDDRLVMVSSGGDVLVWGGTNPTSAADLFLIGRWVVGAVPIGRRVMSDWGGDVVILSTTGLVRLSTLLQGSSSLNDNTFLTKNITRYIRAEMARNSQVYGWSIEKVPNEGIAIISVPKGLTSTGEPVQFVLNTVTMAWSMFRGLDIRCMDKNIRGLYFGTSDGRVMIMEGTTDNINLAGDSSNPITFSLLTRYSHFDTPTIWKRMQFIRPSWYGGIQPAFSVEARFDFDLAELVNAPIQNTPDLSQWDEAIWDQSKWAGGAQSYLETVGLNGMGRHIAIAIRGEAVAELSYIGADIMYDPGGRL